MHLHRAEKYYFLWVLLKSDYWILQRRGLGETEQGKDSPGTRLSLGVGDQHSEVMWFPLVIEAKSDLEDVYLGLESNGKLQEPFCRGEGMASEWRSWLRRIMCHCDWWPGRDCPLLPLAWDEFVIPYFYSFFCQVSMHQRVFRKIVTKLHLFILGVCLWHDFCVCIHTPHISTDQSTKI